MDWTGLTQWTEMFSLDLSDLTVAVLFIIASNLARPAHPFSVFGSDWPHMIDAHKNLLFTCQSCIDFIVASTLGKLPGREGGSRAWKLYRKPLIYWSRSTVQYFIKLLYCVGQSPLSYSIQVAKGWLASFLVSQIIFQICFSFLRWIPEFGYFVNILTLFDSLMVYTECILCFHHLQ